MDRAGQKSRKKHKKDCRRKLVTEGALKSLRPGRTASDSLPGQGSGAILFEARQGGRIDAYFRTRTNGKSQKAKIGTFKKSEKSDGLTLEEIREQARELSSIAKKHSDIKSFIKEREETEKRRKQEQEKSLQKKAKEAQAASACGTLEDLFEDYILEIKSTRSEAYVKEIKRCLERYIKKGFPEIAEMRANEIEPQHLYDILYPVWQGGSQGMSDKLRTYLNAVFNFGMKNDFSQTRQRNIYYRLKNNPVNYLPRDYVPKAITTSLNPEELHYFWNSMQNFDLVGPAIRNFLLFIIATGGQRIEQILREPWTSYDLVAGLLHTTHKKGRSGPRDHLVPLTDRSIRLLEEARSINPHASHPWTSNGKKPININSLGDAIEKWLASKHSKINGKDFKKFTPRDLRRTCKQIMQALGIPATDSNTLQCHDVSGVSRKHYNNNAYAFIPEIRRTIEKYDAGLEKIINGELDELDYYKYMKKMA